MSKPSPVATMVAKIKKLPAPVQKFALTTLVRKTVKLVGTAKLDILEMTPEKVHVRIVNRKIVQNHIGGVHAAAYGPCTNSCWLCCRDEYPGDRLPLLKSMEVHYVKRAQGNLEAVATLDESQREFIKKEEKGDIVVPVVVTDEAGNNPINMTWAWVPKKRKK